MAHRNPQQHSNQHVQTRSNNRQQVGESDYGYRNQQSAFQDSPSQYGVHYGAESQYSGSRQQGSFDPRADVRGYEGSYDRPYSAESTNLSGGGNYETNARGDEYYDTRSSTRAHWTGEDRAHGGLQGPLGDDYRGRQSYGYSRGFGNANPRDYEDNLNARRTHHDPDYQQWREEQIRALDEDYKAWRDERYSNFSNEFGEWRKNRKDRPSTSTGASTGRNEQDADRSTTNASKNK